MGAPSFALTDFRWPAEALLLATFQVNDEVWDEIEWVDEVWFQLFTVVNSQETAEKSSKKSLVDEWNLNIISKHLFGQSPMKVNWKMEVSRK